MKLKRNDFYALICDDWWLRTKKERKDKTKRDPMLCGVFASKKEAQEADKEIKGCYGKHYIKKCKVQVEINL